MVTGAIAAPGVAARGSLPSYQLSLFLP